jgi:hypothetical protein
MNTLAKKSQLSLADKFWAAALVIVALVVILALIRLVLSHLGYITLLIAALAAIVLIYSQVIKEKGTV